MGAGVSFGMHPHSRNRARVAVLALAMTTSLVLAAAAAPARHLRLERSAPADSSVVDSASAIRLWFSQATSLSATRVVVRAAGGDTVPTQPLTQEKAPKSPVVAALASPLPSGTYSVEWRTMAADGHVVRGTFRFTVRPQAP